MNRKEFLAATLGLPLISATKYIQARDLPTPQNNHLMDDDFWQNVRKQFHLDEKFIDLRANSASSMPKASLNKFLTDFQFIEAMPSYRNSEMTDEDFAKLRLKIAKQINCSEKEVALMRNTTEALNNAIFGIPLSKGDEIIASHHEYTRKYFRDIRLFRVW